MEHDAALSSLLKRHGRPARLRSNEARVCHRGHEDTPVDGLEDVVLRGGGVHVLEESEGLGFDGVGFGFVGLWGLWLFWLWVGGIDIGSDYSWRRICGCGREGQSRACVDLLLEVKGFELLGCLFG